MTPEQAAECANNIVDVPESKKSFDDVKEFISKACPRDIQKFFHLLNLAAKDYFLPFARMALEIRLAEDANLIADKLAKQTDRLVKFTIGLWGFTFVLILFAFLQLIIMLLDYCSKNH
jgi:hypothetical protein